MKRHHNNPDLEFDQNTCRECGFWIEWKRPTRAPRHCPDCGTFCPLSSGTELERHMRRRRFYAGSLILGVLGAGLGWGLGWIAQRFGISPSESGLTLRQIGVGVSSGIVAAYTWAFMLRRHDRDACMSMFLLLLAGTCTYICLHTFYQLTLAGGAWLRRAPGFGLAAAGAGLGVITAWSRRRRRSWLDHWLRFRRSEHCFRTREKTARKQLRKLENKRAEMIALRQEHLLPDPVSTRTSLPEEPVRLVDEAERALDHQAGEQEAVLLQTDLKRLANRLTQLSQYFLLVRRETAVIYAREVDRVKRYGERVHQRLKESHHLAPASRVSIWRELDTLNQRIDTLQREAVHQRILLETRELSGIPVGESVQCSPMLPPAATDLLSELREETERLRQENVLETEYPMGC